MARPIKTQLTPFLESTGDTEAVREAEVRARVQGFIRDVMVDPEKEVRQGETLYQIEPDQYEADFNALKASVDAAEAAVGVAEASVETAQATLDQAENELQRTTKLLERQAASQAEYDQALANAQSGRAAVTAAKANVEAAKAELGVATENRNRAKIDLDYTTVTAPIGGRITKTEIKQGNLVEFGTVLTRIVDASQIYANFTISDRQLLELMAARRKSSPGGEPESQDWSRYDVFLKRETDTGYPFKGTLDYIDQAGVDPNFGTLALRAVFDNSDKRLLPGLFVSVRVAMPEKVERMLIKESAISRGPSGPYVLVVGADNRVAKKDISVAETVGGWAMVESGLSTSDQVILSGIQRAIPDAPVVPKLIELDFDESQVLRGVSDSQLSDFQQDAPDTPSDGADSESGNDESQPDASDPPSTTPPTKPASSPQAE
ncbi:efflux RND transporter periplasmic adaptor subunit [Roseiconus nitratireducens]|uniref:efflux RND transporter periplasmic adaptor subunit n=1 Tax=Roseiconus nitratireducens TaxID=2605748 RepID=UPI0013754AD2|nr:efflux RND transporter periplasmic adaptor subunit [Roseiconus nitratireducens]